MKYSKEFKLECIRKRKEGIYIETPPGCKKRHNFTKQVRIWSKIYDSLGEAGLEHGRPTLNTEQRLELIKWHKIYMEKGIDGLKSLKRGKPSMKKKPVSKEDSDKTKEELLKELEYVRAENEYLKKLSALVQERKAREQKKK